MGSRTLAKYSYADGNGNLETQTYGNGAEVNFTYDRLDRIKTTVYSGGRSLSYTYNGDGQLASMTDSATGETYSYTYDSLGRLVTSGQSSNGARLSYRYDDCGRIKSRSFSYPGLSTSAAETYTYDGQGLLESMTMVDWRTISLKYNDLDRLETRNITDNVIQTYTYAPGSQSGTTSNRIATYECKYNGSTKAKFTFEYDKAGNITKQRNADGTTGWAYGYDKQGQLVFASDCTNVNSNPTVAKAKYKYSYDAAGNLTSWQVNNDDNSQTLESHTYTYGNSDWRDLLTAFDGKPITYDAIGNPTKYYDGSTMVWKEGRRLQSITKGGQTTSYQYDANGQRIQKTNPDGSYTKYCVLDGRVIGEIVYKRTSSGVKWSHGVRYIYGDDGSVIGFGIWDANTQNEWERYYFIKNVQGDVLHVYREADNTLVASYEYDPFGKVTITHSVDNVAEDNPFRYRGYYYDTETGFYYLQSRYYDPVTCRFINADGFASTGQSFIGYNMFAYCNNNPIMYSDDEGDWPKLSTVFTTIAVAALAVATVAAVVTVAALAAPALVAVGGTVLSTAAVATAATAIGTQAAAVAAVSTVAAYSTKKVEKKLLQSYSVYFLEDQNGRIQYVGRVTDRGYNARMAYHAATRGLTPAKRISGFSDLTVISSPIIYTQHIQNSCAFETCVCTNNSHCQPLTI